MEQTQMFALLIMMSDAMGKALFHPSPVLGFCLNQVVRYEVVGATDDDNKPVMIPDPNDAKKKIQKLVGLVTFTDGGAIEFTDEQKNQFQPVWNEKLKIDNMLIAQSSAVFNQMFPEKPAANQ